MAPFLCDVDVINNEQCMHNVGARGTELVKVSQYIIRSCFNDLGSLRSTGRLAPCRMFIGLIRMF